MGETIEQKTIRIQLAVAVSIIIALITGAFWAGVNFQTINSDIKELQIGQEHIINSYTREVSNNQARIVQAEKDNIDLKIRLTKIETQLTGIEVLLLELKQDVKEHRELYKN